MLNNYLTDEFQNLFILSSKQIVHMFYQDIHRKKGQLTIPAILAILLIFGTLFITISSINRSKKEMENSINTYTADAPRLFIDLCLEMESKNSLVLAGSQAGYVSEFPPNMPYLDTEKTRFYLLYKTGVRLLPSLDSIARNLSSHITLKVKECAKSLEYRKDMGIVKLGSPTSNTSIEEASVAVYLNYPMTVTKDRSIISMSEFWAEHEIKLSKIYSAVEEILQVVEDYDTTYSSGQGPDISLLESRYKEISEKYGAEEIFIYAYTPRLSKVTLWLITDKSGTVPYNFQFATEMR